MKTNHDGLSTMQLTALALAAEGRNRCNLYVDQMPPMLNVSIARGATDEVLVVYPAGETRVHMGSVILINKLIGLDNLNAASRVDLRAPTNAS